MSLLDCQLNPNVITVGQKATLSCKIGILNLPNEAKLEITPPKESASYTLVPLNSAQFDKQDLQQVITSYQVGTHDLKDFKFKINDVTYNPADLKLEVKSVIQQPNQKPFPNFDPVHARAPWWWWTLWIIAIGIFAGAIFVQIQKKLKSRRKPNVQEAVLTPEEKFKARMRKLESQGFHLKRDFKIFALELTNILKTAMSEQLAFSAEDLTTEEILDYLRKKHKNFYVPVEARLQNIFTELDQIKFAKIETTTERCQGLLDSTNIVGRMLFGGRQ